MGCVWCWDAAPLRTRPLAVCWRDSLSGARLSWLQGQQAHSSLARVLSQDGVCGAALVRVLGAGCLQVADSQWMAGVGCAPG